MATDRNFHYRIAALLFLAALNGSAAMALDESYCQGYATKAVEQTNEYQFRKCTKPGNSQWWSNDPAYHFNWCAGLPEGSDLAQKGEADRSEVLSACKSEAAQRSTPAGAPRLSFAPRRSARCSFARAI